jgi:hypothetical protein
VSGYGWWCVPSWSDYAPLIAPESPGSLLKGNVVFFKEDNSGNSDSDIPDIPEEDDTSSM